MTLQTLTDPEKMNRKMGHAPDRLGVSRCYDYRNGQVERETDDPRAKVPWTARFKTAAGRTVAVPAITEAEARGIIDHDYRSVAARDTKRAQFRRRVADRRRDEAIGRLAHYGVLIVERIGDVAIEQAFSPTSSCYREQVERALATGRVEVSERDPETRVPTRLARVPNYRIAE